METRGTIRANISLNINVKIDEKNGQKFSIAKGNAFEAKVLDISTTGIGILSKYFLPKGLFVELEIDGKLFELDEIMKIKSEIRYCNSIKPSGYRCGLKFIDIPSKYSNKIGDLIASYERRQAQRLQLSE